MGRAARELAAGFSVEAMLDAYELLYRVRRT